MKKSINRLFLTLLIHEIILIALEGIIAQRGWDLGWLSVTATGIAGIIFVLRNLKNTKGIIFADRTRYAVMTSKENDDGTSEMIVAETVVRRMTFGKFMILLCFMAAAQMLGTAISSLFALIGITGNDITQTVLNSLTPGMIVYAGILGPVIEELVYRGTVCGSLMKYGRGYAIIVSAIVFGLMHMTLEQFLTAGLLGLIFGYVFTKYSIKWSIALHIANNLIFAIGISLACGGNAEMETYVTAGLLIAGTIAAIIYAVKNRQMLAITFRGLFADTEPGAVKALFKSPCFWIYITLLIGGICLDIFAAGMV